MKAILLVFIGLIFCGGDREILAKIFHEMGGEKWFNRSGWGSEEDMKYWFGVSVNNEGRVVELELSNNNVNGPLSKWIGLLNDLETINFINNSISGVIPTEFGNLKNLKYLWLGKNKIHGSFPSLISGLRKLEILDLTGNKFGGIIPETRFNKQLLPNLREILISRNLFSGSLPSSILTLPRLRILSVSNNRITSLPDLSSSNLYAFFARQNLIATYPLSLEKSTIKVVDLVNNLFDCRTVPTWDTFSGASCVQSPSSSLAPMVALGNPGSGGRTKIDYYAYSKCPYYVSMESELVQISPDLDDLYELNLYFFGKVDSSYPTGFYCKHGQEECYGNFASICAINLLNNNRSQWLVFTQCENKDYQSIPANQDACATKAGLNLDAFHSCISKDGPRIFTDEISRANSLGVTGSPTDFVNDVEQADWDVGASGYNKLICRNYQGTDPLPDVCKS